MKSLSARLFFSVLVTLFLVIVSMYANAQLAQQYHPRGTHSELSRDLIEGLASQFETEDESMSGSREIRQINFERRVRFMEKVLDGAFIKDDSLERYVSNVLQTIVANNDIHAYLRRVLILSSPHVNAVCYGQGIYAVTVSLLARVENEDQLAFILAHELAHDELGHIRTRIVQEADLDLEDRARDQTMKIISGKVIKKEIDEFRRVLYDYSKHSRKNEMRADSMALILLRNANYREKEAFSALSILQQAQTPKHPVGVEMFLPLHTPSYPFQDYWLNDRLSVYSKRYMGTFLYASDSIETHPSIESRKAVLRKYIVGKETTVVNQSAEFVNAVIEIASFETVESAYKNKEYDLALYHALQLYARYPQNAYLTSRIGKIFTDLYEAKGSNRLQNYVTSYTPNYCDELKLINGFLHNLTQQELGEIAFHFLTSNKHFSATQKSHYYLVWKVGSLTKRKDLIANISERYNTKFGGAINSYKYQ